VYYEYGVEPQTIGADWPTFKYWIEKFGFDRGRLISQYPKRWFREVHEAGQNLKPIERSRITEALKQAKKNKIIRCNRPYDPNSGDWLYNALTDHQRRPFHAIVAKNNPTGSGVVLLADDADENQPLMAVATDCSVRRDAPSLVAAMKEMLQSGSQILFIDPFFSPFDGRYRDTLRECLRVVGQTNVTARCEIHYRRNNRGAQGEPAAPDAIRQAAANIFPGVIPVGLTVTLFCWQEKIGGEDFHARYLLTDKGGIRIDAGFSAHGSHQTTDMQLMSYKLSQEKLAFYARTSTVYQLVEPVIRVAANCQVQVL
jgi:hypothetical protein